MAPDAQGSRSMAQRGDLVRLLEAEAGEGEDNGSSRRLAPAGEASRRNLRVRTRAVAAGLLTVVLMVALAWSSPFASSQQKAPSRTDSGGDRPLLDLVSGEVPPPAFGQVDDTHAEVDDAAVAVLKEVSAESAAARFHPSPPTATWGSKQAEASCLNYGCLGYNPDQSCQCNVACMKWHSCCADFTDQCVRKAPAPRGPPPAPAAAATTPHPVTRAVAPPECHTAVKGEKCYEAIFWAHDEGLHTNPAVYGKDLTAASTMEDFQNFLHVTTHFEPFAPSQKNGCPKPCATITHFPATTSTKTTTTTYLGQGITLFCFSLIRPGYEFDILVHQRKVSQGIFACNEQVVLSGKVLDLGGGMKTVVIPQVAVGWSKDGTAGNALQFMKAWEQIHADGRYKTHDWTVKVDPDAVLLADRLRGHLSPYNGRNVYIRNCDKPMSEGTMMFGSLEPISRTALTAYFANTERCMKELPWQAWGEDLYMMRCLEKIGVGPVGDFSIIQDGVCKGVWCGNNWAAAFHPMKSVGAWQNCWQQAVAAR
mmetsp:Transcript_32324/g.68859  ORF Transcript_32324/g.68859 Transcript_32324/m.68859 type:complete len:536 (-) Transcript_32324:82-1689(-)